MDTMAHARRAQEPANSAAQPFGAPSPSDRLTVGIIGVGRVGLAIGMALARAGHAITGASGRSATTQARIAQRLAGTPRLAPTDVARGADLVILAIPDDALAPTVADLAAAGAFHPGQVVAHTSGAHGIGMLHPAVALGARPMALHPAMTFTGRADDADRLTAGISFGVTVPADLRDVAATLVAELGGTPEWIPEERRALYHTALAHGANHLVTLLNEALDRLRDAGVAAPERVLSPLLHAALDNTLAFGDGALTGPVSRGDAGTVAKHIEVLRAVAPDSAGTYVALARRTADRAIAAGQLSPADAEPLLGVLADRREDHPVEH